jgi:hypothetical protein
MSYPASVDIRRGSKVFARGEEIGEVVDLSPNAVDVQKGLLRKHTYRVPMAYVVEAAEGVVDLDIDREGVEALELGRHDRDADGISPDDLPDEYLAVEYGERRTRPPDPPVF